MVALLKVSMFRFLYNNPRLFFVLFVTFVTILYWLFPEIMPYNKGFAFEGFTIYKPFAQDAYNTLFVEKMNSYSIQRILPYLLLNVSFNVFGIEFSDSNMLWFFKVLHYVLLLLIIYTWGKLSSCLKLGLSGQWVGYMCLLMNVSNLKFDFYVPFTYDKLAVVSGLISVCFYFSNKKYFLLINSLVALIIWPTSIIFNMIMLFVTYDVKVVINSNRVLSAVWAFFVAGTLIGLFILVIYVKQIPELPGIVPTVHQLLPLSIFLVLIYLVYTQYNLARLVLPGGKEMISKLKEMLRPDFRWVSIIVVASTYFLLTRVLGDATTPYLTPQKFAINFTYCSLQRPGQSLVAHSVFFGLPILLLVLFRKRLLPIVANLGYGMVVMCMIVLIQAVNSETRQMSNVLILIVLPVALAADSFKANYRTIWGTFGVSLFLSKVWFPFNLFNLDKSAASVFPMNDFEKMNFLAWPQQAFFMNMGPWTANKYLIIQAIIILALYLILHKLWMKNSVHDTMSTAAD